ncbi:MULTISPECIES: HU family DNA-binding protein [Treponema]|uniref:DNA-binding protein HU-beta n=1 Tax=Treponema rectale TaxID=744512 RepID=A0A840SBR9_9SPIR|nr:MULTISPECIES: HU family DNA-binding protein [Treponema]MBB5218160.1 DNA-binding protein HU-beta [Treponema rectale]MBE6354460.1 HU family DNA-binding protein [Treponema sp.]MBO6177447.1 HU family DNA-binding protein [Treponema sp.]QOS40134.1 HU family DNA-binding protein [Treponema rectale]
MKRTELVDAIAKDTGLTKKDADAAIKSFIENVTKAISSGDDVALVGFGTFTVSERAARDGINPLTKEKIHIPAAKAPKFKAGKALKDAVNKK